MPVTESRESGIEILDVEAADLEEGVDGTVFRTEEDVDIVAGQTVQERPIETTADHFVAASVDTVIEHEMNPMEAQLQGLSPDDEAVEEQEDGSFLVTKEIDESSVFIASEDGEMGYGLLTVDGGDIEDAIEDFEEQYL